MSDGLVSHPEGVANTLGCSSDICQPAWPVSFPLLVARNSQRMKKKEEENKYW